ncbi:MAG: Thiamine-monophosphate kinase [Elusimicrobia bacterium ADurb.Bin231]|nr:MAG: Thiamine-monophosphate kinase [Elusimicrobia bacterium ADurb.Bin231]
MKISKIGEFGLIERIRKRANRVSKRKEILTGIGDDCAVIKNTGTEYLLVTTDTLSENVHFSKKYFSAFDIGYKSLAVNLSDIAAMGGIPMCCLVTLCLPNSITIKEIDELYRGINFLAAKYNVQVIGGDIIKSLSGLTVSISLIGKTLNKRGILRNGAAPGDNIFCTGSFGDSAAGLFAFQKGIAGMKYLKEKHLRPNARIQEGIYLARTGKITSMIDSSDGLDKSLRILCEESKTGCVIDYDKIPISAELKRFTSLTGIGLERMALYGGEEYELIFTASQKHSAVFSKKFSKIGIVTKQKQISYINKTGKVIKIGDRGFDHFSLRDK